VGVFTSLTARTGTWCFLGVRSHARPVCPCDEARSPTRLPSSIVNEHDLAEANAGERGAAQSYRNSTRWDTLLREATRRAKALNGEKGRQRSPSADAMNLRRRSFRSTVSSSDSAALTLGPFGAPVLGREAKGDEFIWERAIPTWLVAAWFAMPDVPDAPRKTRGVCS
jgi:hypothetical protein